MKKQSIVILFIVYFWAGLAGIGLPEMALAAEGIESSAAGPAVLPGVAGSVDDLWRQPVIGGRHRASSFDRSGQNIDCITIMPDRRAVLLDHTGSPGSIRRVWFTITSTEPDYLETVKFRFTFDGEATVNDVPVGMLTATGPWRVNDLTSPVINTMRARYTNRDNPGTGRGSFNILWPMPFAKSAKVEVLNGCKTKMLLHFYVDYQLHPVGERPLLFHATYNRRCFTSPRKHDAANDPKTADFVFADIRAVEGRYVGTVMAVESHPSRKGKWYEGDDRFIIDGRTQDMLHGTGTEDYFGMSWGVHRPYQGHDHGVTHYERKLTDHDRMFDGRFVVYRWHLVDAIEFHDSLHASIEAGHRNECEQHYESTAFWYGRKKPADEK